MNTMRLASAIPTASVTFLFLTSNRRLHSFHVKWRKIRHVCPLTPAIAKNANAPRPYPQARHLDGQRVDWPRRFLEDRLRRIRTRRIERCAALPGDQRGAGNRE